MNNILVFKCCKFKETYKVKDGVRCSACGYLFTWSYIKKEGIQLNKYDLCKRNGSMFYECISCNKPKLDIDLHQSGECGSCQSERIRKKIMEKKN